MNRIIGLCGVAGSGKDLFYSLLSKKIKCERYALADSLKEEVSSWCQENYNICPVHCSREEKNEIRSFLVFHGKMKRENSKGRHWINKLQEKMNWWQASNPFAGITPPLTVVTDIRYNYYDKDEVYWLKNELKGTLVHISQFEYRRKEACVPRGEEGTLVKKFKEPANEDERKWDPVLKSLSDYKVEWPKIESENIEEDLIKYIDKFLLDFNK